MTGSCRKVRSTLLLCVAALAGCSNQPAATHLVEGLVRYRDQPLIQATVRFEPIAATSGKRYASRATTDDQGRYQLTTFVRGDGAVAGRYRVAIEPYLPSIPDSGPPPKIPNPLPAKFSDPVTSGLEYDVVPDRNEINIDLR